jgi:hypothetical protein
MPMHLYRETAKYLQTKSSWQATPVVRGMRQIVADDDITLFRWLGDDSSNTDLLKRIFIVPALEFTAKLSVPDQESFVVPHEKSEAVRLVSQHVIQPMHKYFPPAYGPTDYARWYKTKAPYEVPYELFFEPVCFYLAMPQ